MYRFCSVCTREVGEYSDRLLAVLPVGDVGWSDLGTPERVRAAITKFGLKSQWQESDRNADLYLAKTSVT